MGRKYEIMKWREIIKLSQRSSIYFLRRFLLFLTVPWTHRERGRREDVNGQKEAVRREILAGGGDRLILPSHFSASPLITCMVKLRRLLQGISWRP
jgi:hypothetical protein